MANNQSVRRHLDAFTRGRIIGKLEECRSVTSVARQMPELLNASTFHDFGDNFKLQEQLSGAFSECPRGTTPRQTCLANHAYLTTSNDSGASIDSARRMDSNA
ncbi:hypothetical protein TNCV_1682171 [Trichonephila clavipes]|nr:hypothetical protein TNCV_1682171 [Trichonephila clavipes]